MLLNNGQTIPLAPQALGETSPVMATGWFYAKDGMSLERRFAYYGEIYKSQPWVNAAVDKRAKSIARLSLRVWNDQPNLKQNLDSSSAYAKLLGSPSSFLHPFSFWRWCISTYDIYGEMFLYKLRDRSGQVVELIPMHPSRTFVQRASGTTDWEGSQSGDLRYVFTIGTATYGYLTADASDVVAWMRYNPDSEMRGVSLLEPLRSTIMNEDSARRAMAGWWRNMGRPSLAISVDAKLDASKAKRVKADFDAIHSGSDNAGGVIVMPSGMQAIPFQLTAEEMSYIESRKMNREEVAGVFDLPPPTLQITDNATFSNITEQFLSLYRDSLAPVIEDLESLLDANLGPEFPGHKLARFAVDDLLRGNFETRAQAAATLLNGVFRPNEMRALFDLDPLGEEGEQVYINSAYQPLGSIRESITMSGPTAELVPEDYADAQDPPTPPPVPDPTATPAAPTAAPPATSPPQASAPPTKPKPGKHYRTIMGRVGRGKSLNEVRDEMLATVDDTQRAELLADLALAEKRTQ